jgi:hypothetical protein
MKIYINHFNLFILPDLLKNLSKYKINSEEFLQVYSPDGIYLIDESSTMILKPVDRDIVILNNFYENYTLIIDPSFYIIEKTHQIPQEHISTKIKKEFYKLNKNYMKLVIEFEEIIQTDTIENGYTPKDIYFELSNSSNINDALVKEELIVFLSLLN